MSLDLQIYPAEQEQQQIIQRFNALSAENQSENQNKTHHATAYVLPEIIQCSGQTQSTNDDAKALFQQGYTSALILTQQQTQGRGQRQNQWHSAQGNIYLTVLHPLSKAMDGRLSLECALNILQCPTLKALNEQNIIKIKWANDLYSEQGKWGGILIEPLQRNGQHFAVIGVGINVKALPQQDISQPITSLDQLGLTQYHRIDFIIELYHALTQAIQWFEFGSQNLAQRFAQSAMFINQNVQLQRTDGTLISGIFQGIQHDGAMLILDEQGQSNAYYDVRLISHHHSI